MARPYWSGSLQISLVSFGVSLYVATETKSQITFHQISRSTGERIRQQKVLESAARERELGTVIEQDEIVKGYEYRKGQYVVIEPSEIENLRVPSKHTIAVSQFVDLNDLKYEFFEKPYFVIPENESQTEPFGVIRQALTNAGKAAIGKLAFSGREHIVAVIPATKESLGMMAFTLRYQYELRDQVEFFGNLRQSAIDADSLELAETLIARMSGKFELSKFEDGYENALKTLVEAKINNLPLPANQTSIERPSNVINLMDALRRSLNDGNQLHKKPPKRETRLDKVSTLSSTGAGKSISRRKSA